MKIDIQKEVQPHFKPVWTTKRPYNLLKGGRNSFKSSVIALLLVYKMLKYIKNGQQANIVVIRKVGNTLRDSVFLKIQWALRKFHVLGWFKVTVTPFKITNLKTGSTFYFYGQDDFQKLKSNDIGNIIAVWYEEAAEFSSSEEFDQTNATFMRQKQPLAKLVYFFWSYNPPRDSYSWINKWAEDLKNDPTYLVDSSTYLDDQLGFITPQMLEEINRIKQNDYDYYQYLYLGVPVGLGNSVWKYSLFQQINEIDDVLKDDFLTGMAFSSDVGHEVSATTTGCWLFTYSGKVILWNTYYYSPEGKSNKKAPSQLAEDVISFEKQRAKEFADTQVVNDTMDSAEGGLRNQIKLMTGHEPHPVHKLKKVTMIEMTQDLLAQGRVYIVKRPENEIFLQQAQKYRWDQKTLQTQNPEVVKVDDHTCDSFQYMCVDNAQRLRLRR
ncbi:MAG: PBSX family phage terminase large subunit [Oenococcus sp.]|uniref:PBSX family phage terminase large subunit n=1 Tax=Oenococcus sp. TaxID=1979414 RepID=UPI0039ED31DD